MIIFIFSEWERTGYNRQLKIKESEKVGRTKAFFPSPTDGQILATRSHTWLQRNVTNRPLGVNCTSLLHKQCSPSDRFIRLFTFWSLEIFTCDKVIYHTRFSSWAKGFYLGREHNREQWLYWHLGEFYLQLIHCQSTCLLLSAA